jgi:predicted TIM-barrel fold metal-dependent hydrolase
MPSEIIDFHGHFFPLEVVPRRPNGLMPALASAWELLTDARAQLELAAAAGTDFKVVNAPLSSIAPVARVAAADLPARTNDALAAEVQRHDGRLIALASVDAYRGDAGAEEARRAVEELGMPGILVDAAQGEELLSDPIARPTLAYAAGQGIPVFAHPVNPPTLPNRYATAGRHGVLLARGTESALSTLGLLAGRVFDELADLKLVLAGIGAAALLLAPFLDDQGQDGDPSGQRSLLHIDTMGFDPKAIRFAVETVGADRVLIGSDWPIMWRDASRERVHESLSNAGLNECDKALVAAGNARRLLGLRAGERRPQRA